MIRDHVKMKCRQMIIVKMMELSQDVEPVKTQRPNHPRQRHQNV